MGVHRTAPGSQSSHAVVRVRPRTGLIPFRVRLRITAVICGVVLVAALVLATAVVGLAAVGLILVAFVAAELLP